MPVVCGGCFLVCVRVCGEGVLQVGDGAPHAVTDVFQFASEFVEKAFFKSVMVRLMQAALTGSVEDHGRLLTAELLAVDDKLLKLAAASRDFSGTSQSITGPVRLYALVCFISTTLVLADAR